jgi:TatD DNase family protein
MTDSHCHLADETFAGDLDQVIARAREAGVERALVILEAGNAKEAAQAERVAGLWPEVRFSIGVHPHQAHQFAGDPEKAATVVREQLAATPAARDLQRPVVIHTREADEDIIAILREEGGGEVRGVLHCFTGNDALADRGLALGFFVSLAGIVTFPKAEPLRQTARRVPLDRLLAETDSPFLAPVPYRGKRNEPAYVARVVAALAGLHQIPPGELAERTTANFHALFRP